MAFELQKFNTVSSGSNKKANTLWAYTDELDTAATISAANYFDSIAGRLAIGDLIYVNSSDSNFWLLVTAVSPHVTTSAFPSVPANSITTAMLQNGSVTLAKLAAGITPSHVVQYAGKAANGGGSATIVITVTGLTTSHICFAQIQGSTNAVTVQKVTPTANTLTVLLSGDPGAATTVAYQALLAAS